ncbi:MAG: ATP-binding cassette domain-containing protein [Dehalococcoidales bacterium]|nr:ATP-binding cassette domain-containing protein [Dehalococcoidales bacterium]
MLKVANMVKIFGGLTALNDISFEIGKGDIVGIIGPNGSGKTTLFEIISGFSSPNSGHVFLKGEKIDGLKPHQIFSRGLARSFQLMENYHSLTAYETVLLPLLSMDARKRDSISPGQLLSSLGFEAGLNSPLSHLSLPDRHTVELARVLITGPDIVLLDEVMSGLNPEQIGIFTGRIKQERERGVSFLIIEHYIDTLMSLCDRLIVLDQGRKIIEDTPARALEKDDVVNSYLGAGSGNAVSE